ELNGHSAQGDLGGADPAGSGDADGRRILRQRCCGRPQEERRCESDRHSHGGPAWTTFPSSSVLNDMESLLKSVFRPSSNWLGARSLDSRIGHSNRTKFPEPSDLTAPTTQKEWPGA